MDDTCWDSDFVQVKGGTVTGAVNNSYIFVKGRTVEIPDMLVCQYEVSQAEYAQYMYWDGTLYAPTEEYGKGDNYPAYNVNWYEAVMYCNLRSEANGLTPAYYMMINGQKETDIAKWKNVENSCISSKEEDGVIKYSSTVRAARSSVLDAGIKFDQNANGYRLPTEAEWEYIARGENKMNFNFSGSNIIGDVGWYTNNSGGQTHPNPSFTSMAIKPNSLVVNNMTGNVREWCWDWEKSIDDMFANTPATGPEYSEGVTKYRASRGGGVTSNILNSYIKNNWYTNPYFIDYTQGFRVVRTITQ